MIEFSTSNLIKQSAKQLWYLRNRPKPTYVSKRQKEGTKHQEKVSTSDYKEMRGVWKNGEILLYYCFDEIVPKDTHFELIEHKMVKGESFEDWYLTSSIIQTALYHALAIDNIDNTYYTAKFLQKKGIKCKSVVLNKPIRSFLKFGRRIYEINVKSIPDLVGFYREKAKASFTLKSAELFDYKYKHKEWKYLKDYIHYKQLN